MASRTNAVVRRRHSKEPVSRTFVGVLMSIVGTVLAVMVLALVSLGGVGFGLYALVAKDLQDPQTLATRDVPLSTQVFDRKGRLLYEFFDPKVGRRSYANLTEISPYLIQATIATEDASFYENQGVNLKGMMRALLANVSQQEIQQGGSSITQQLVKNVFIPEEQRAQASIVRKIKEVILAVELTRRFSKDEILTYYLNENNYGNLSYGVESAAESYFGKSAKELDLAEASMLAGIPQAPANFSPFTNPEQAKQRQRQVLDLMVRQSFITKNEADGAFDKQLEYKTAKFDIQAPHFVMYVRDLLQAKYGLRGLYRSGYKVTTTLDLDLQDLGQSIVTDQVNRSHKYGAFNGALVAIDPRSGEILSMVGSADYFDETIDGQVNIATSERQPGSSFKPFTYVTAFMKGWNPATMVLDVPLTVRDGVNAAYSPHNWDNKWAGPVSIRQALANSMNIPALKAIQFTGIDAVLDTAHKMGITTLNRKGWYGISLTLGGGEVKLVDLTYAYTVFANNGVMNGVPVQPDLQQPGLRKLDPVAILKIEDRNGNIVEQFDGPQSERIMPAEYSYLITNILSDNVARAPTFGGTLQLPGPRPAAVKTGTTDNVRDFWTVGYTPELVTGVWMGNSDNKALTGGFSGDTIGPMWERFMRGALDGAPITPFTRPPGIVGGTVCAPSGLLVTPECQRTKSDIFVAGQMPTQKDNLWRKIGDKFVLVLPDEAASWIASAKNGEYATESMVKEGQLGGDPGDPNAPPGSKRSVILSPAPNQVISGKLPIRVTVDGPGVEQWWVEISKDGAGGWVQIRPPMSDSVSGFVYGDLDTQAMGMSGSYVLRLTVRRAGGEVEQKTVPVTIGAAAAAGGGEAATAAAAAAATAGGGRAQ